MTNLEYISQQIEYAEEQLMVADSMADRAYWGDKVDALEAQYLDEAGNYVSQDARDSVPQILTVNYT